MTREPKAPPSEPKRKGRRVPTSSWSALHPGKLGKTQHRFESVEEAVRKYIRNSGRDDRAIAQSIHMDIINFIDELNIYSEAPRIKDYVDNLINIKNSCINLCRLIFDSDDYTIKLLSQGIREYPGPLEEIKWSDVLNILRYRHPAISSDASWLETLQALRDLADVDSLPEAAKAKYKQDVPRSLWEIRLIALAGIIDLELNIAASSLGIHDLGRPDSGGSRSLYLERNPHPTWILAQQCFRVMFPEAGQEDHPRYPMGFQPKHGDGERFGEFFREIYQVATNREATEAWKTYGSPLFSLWKKEQRARNTIISISSKMRSLPRTDPEYANLNEYLNEELNKRNQYKQMFSRGVDIFKKLARDDNRRRKAARLRRGDKS